MAFREDIQELIQGLEGPYGIPYSHSLLGSFSGLLSALPANNSFFSVEVKNKLKILTYF